MLSLHGVVILLVLCWHGVTMWNPGAGSLSCHPRPARSRQFAFGDSAMMDCFALGSGSALTTHFR